MLQRKAFLHYGSTVVGAILGFVALKLIALYLGDRILGEVAYAMGLVGLANGLLQLGFPSAHKKRYAEGEDDADKLATYLVVRIGLILLLLLGVAGFIGVYVGILGRGFRSTTLLTVVAMAVYHTLKNIEDLCQTTFDAKREIARGQAQEIADNVMRMLATALLALVYAATVHGRGPLADRIDLQGGWMADWGPELLALAYIAGAAAAAAVGLWYLFREHEIGSVDLSIFKSYSVFALPLFAASIVDKVSNYIDRVSLGYFWTGSEVGIYFAARRITSVLFGIAFALTAVLLPAVSKLAGEGEHDRIRDIEHRAHRYTSMVLLPIVAMVIVFADDLVRIVLSSAFEDSGSVLAILAVYAYVMAISRPQVAVLLGLDHPKVSAMISGISSILNILANLLLVPTSILGITLLGLGADGAALATLGATFVSYGLSRLAANRILGVRSVLSHVVRHFAAIIAVGSAVWWTKAHIIGLPRWYHVGALSAAGALVYIGLLVLLREFDRDDWDFLIELLDLREMVDYIKGELFG